MTRYTRRAYLGRWLRCRYPGGDRPRRNAVRRTWYTAADIRKAQQRAREWAYMLDGDEPVAMVQGPVTVTSNAAGTEVAAWSTMYVGPAVQKAPTVQSIAEEVYGLGLPPTHVDPVKWPGFEPQTFAICPAMMDEVEAEARARGDGKTMIGWSGTWVWYLERTLLQTPESGKVEP